MPRNLPAPLADKNYIDALILRGRELSDTLGDLCRYEVKGVEITPKDLFDLLSKHGIEDWAPVDIRPRTAARKAITRIRPMLEDPENDLRVIVRPVHTPEADVVRYAIIDETTDVGALDLDFETRNQVIFRIDTGTMEFTKQTVPEIVDEFEYLCSVYTDAEITMMVRNIVNGFGCIRMNDNSGMFFILRSNKKIVDSLLKVFDELKGMTTQKCYFRPIAVLDDAQNRATMGEALVADIGMELDKATETLDSAIANSSKRGMSSAVKRFKIAKGKARLYQDMLQINMDSINQRMDAANVKVNTLMQELIKGDGDA